MGWLWHVWTSFKSLLQRDRLEAEMAAELQFHLEMQSAEYQRQGLSRTEAERAARRDLGGVEQVKEYGREALGFLWIQDLWRDLKYGALSLVRSPGFSIAAVLTLALGIGANTAVFSVVNSVVLEPLPYVEPDRLVMLWEDNPKVWNNVDQVNTANFLDWQRENRVLESMGFVGSQQAASRNFLLQRGDTSIRLRGRYAGSGLFKVLGVAPLHGLPFEETDDVKGAEKTIILSHGLWTRLFQSDPNVIGQTIDLGEPHRIRAVMPRGFAFPQDAEIWLSWSGFPSRAEHIRGWHSLWAVARLKPGVTPAQAEAELTGIQQRIAAENPNAQKIATHVKVVPLLDQVIGSGTEAALYVLLAAVGFVLLIACANVANLLLARAAARQKELALRTALGAGRLRIIRQLLTESVLLAVIGGAVGVLLAVWGIEVLQLIRPDGSSHHVKDVRFDRVRDVALDLRVLQFTLLASLSTGLIFGLLPAIDASRVNLNDVLKADGRSMTLSRGGRRFGNALLIAEIALSLVLLMGAVQMVQTYQRMQQVDTGVRAESVVQAEVDLGTAARVYSGSAQDIYYQIRERLLALPHVVSVSGGGEGPLVASGWQDTVALHGSTVAQISDLPTSDVRVIAPGMFETLGVPLLRGRDLTEEDTEQTPFVVVVNEEFARQFCNGESPIGRTFQFRGVGRRFEIVGLVGDVRTYSLQSTVKPEIYGAYRQSFFTGAELGPILVVRTSGDPRAAMETIRSTVEGPNPPGPILKDLKLAQQVLASSASTERFQAILLAVFAGLALVLAVVGVYGVISYTTAQRVPEIGIRMALGAPRSTVLRSVVGRGLVLALCGVTLGTVLSVVLSRVLSSAVHGVTAVDPLTLVCVSIGLTLVAGLACLLPARRAMKVDPMLALRQN